ncbi:unnamed protein product [Echinostoma caproni]|uniref:Uncharacterized protein n=1 Tax=Echinostoma caproni TaxID=27848 RepID=A0A183B9A6_9TREM|nr:unnamed protein product [Echinostoma caproni]
MGFGRVQRAATTRESAGSITPSGPFSRAHSAKLPSSSRSFSKLDTVIIHHSRDEVAFATPKISGSRPDSTRLERSKAGSKPSAASLTLKRHRGHELLMSNEDTPELIAMHELKASRGAYTKQLDELDPNKTPNLPGPSTSRRASCQSDGSQTALINLDPVVAVTAAAKGLSQATRHLRPSEPFGSTEMKPILPTGREGKQTIRPICPYTEPFVHKVFLQLRGRW